MRRLLSGRNGQRGQAIVEFGLVSIVFFIVVFGLIDVGRAVWNYNTLAQATREGTRYGIVHGAASDEPSGPGDEAAVISQVEQFAGGLDESRLTVTATWPEGSNAVGNRVTVASEYSFIPFFDMLGIGSFTISSSSTMEITH